MAFHLDEEEAKVAAPLITSGSTEVDNKLGGGIPPGSLTLVEGQSDSGKSVFTQQLIWGSLNNGCKVVLFSLENTVKTLMKQMNSLSLGVLDQFLLGFFNVYPVQLMQGENTLERCFDILAEALQNIPRDRLVIVDSLTPFVTHASIERTIAFFETCKTLCNEDMTMIHILHSYAFSENTLIRIRSMCDGHLRLRVEEVGDKLVKVLEVAKIRGASKDTGNIVSFDIEPGWGMRIIPISKAKC